MPQILKIHPGQPEEELIHEACRVLKAGGVAALPTETFYALAADAMNSEAVERIFRIKGRHFNTPIALIAGSQYDIAELVTEIPRAAQPLMRAFWPGPLTLLFSASSRIIPRLTAGTGKIGIRVSSHPIADRLANALNGPITATSANLSGMPECTSAGKVLADLGDRIDLVIDGGRTPGGRGSTFLDTTTVPPTCLREGAVSLSRIQNLLEVSSR